MKIIFKKPYIYWFFIIFLIYISLQVIFSGFYRVIPYIPIYYKTINWSELGVSILFTLIIGLLVSANSVYGYIIHKKRKEMLKSTGLTCTATIGSFATGVCPVCVSGIFPFILNLMGITFTWAVLPFNGIEIQFIIILMLGFSLYLMQRH